MESSKGQNHLDMHANNSLDRVGKTGVENQRNGKESVDSDALSALPLGGSTPLTGRSGAATPIQSTHKHKQKQKRRHHSRDGSNTTEGTTEANDCGTAGSENGQSVFSDSGSMAENEEADDIKRHEEDALNQWAFIPQMTATELFKMVLVIVSVQLDFVCLRSIFTLKTFDSISSSI